MLSAHFLLLIIAIILWFIAGISGIFWPQQRVHVGWLGMFFYGLSLLVR